MTVLHRLSKHATSSRATHSIQSRFEFLILNSNIVQEYTILCSDEQIDLFTGRPYRKAGNRQIGILQNFYLILSLSSQVTPGKNLIVDC